MNQRDKDELKTIFLNLKLGAETKHWDVIDNAVQRLAEFIINLED